MAFNGLMSFMEQILFAYLFSKSSGLILIILPFSASLLGFYTYIFIPFICLCI